MKERIATYRQNVDRKLIIRQRIFLFIISILTGVSVFNVVEGKLGVVLAAIGFAGSTALGLALSRMFKIIWHEEKGKVVSKLDAWGAFFLVLYIGLELGRTWIFEHWLAGAALNAFGLIVLTGLLLGRFIGTSLRIRSTLEDNL